MNQLIRTTIRPLIRSLGIDIIRYERPAATDTGYPADFTADNIAICDAVKAYTMTSPERVNALVDAVRYVVGKGIEGSMVECGVWKGGSTMAMALTLKSLGEMNRDLYLYDTYSGMSAPTEFDVSVSGSAARDKFSETKTSEDTSNWCLSPLEEVQRNVLGTGYPGNKCHFVRGKVEDTIPANLPGRIALLRLDTDWYESTKHELMHLFPLLQSNGVLLVDDYGHWAGARRAVDEYFATNSIRILLSRIDYTGRIAIKN